MGCFNKTREVADTLANAMVTVSAGLGIKTTAFITEMDNPIGKAVGNSVEVAESLDCLNGKGPEDLLELVCKQGIFSFLYPTPFLIHPFYIKFGLETNFV